MIGRLLPALLTTLLTMGFARAADPGKTPAVAPESVFPKAPPADRYTALAARSPFSPPTAPAPVPMAPTAPPPPGWAEKYVLGSVAQFGPGYKVTLTPKNPASGPNALPTERVTVATGETHPEGISIGSVVWNDQPSQTRITLLKNGVPGMFTFESAALSPGITAPNAARGGIPPNVVNSNSPRGGNNGSMQTLPPAAPPPPQPFQPPQFQPGIVTPPNVRAPIRAAPPAPPFTAPRVMAPPGPPLPGSSNAADDDDDE